MPEDVSTVSEQVHNTTAADVVSLYQKFEIAGIKIWLDGGWAVDALLGQQTRPHGDVDILVQQKDIYTLRLLLEAGGYTEIPRDDASEHGFHLGNKSGVEVDVHGIILDNQSAWKHADPIEEDIYPPESLQGSGTINGTPIRTLSAEYVVLFHTGYNLTEKDFKDVSALCQKFNIQLPREYLKFK